MQMKRLSRLLALAWLIFGILFLVGCPGVTPPPDYSPLDQAKFNAAKWLGIYNSQFEDYKSMTANPDTLTEAQKEVLRKKKALLVETKPALDLYTSYVDQGVVPSPETEQSVLDLINRLQGLATQ